MPAASAAGADACDCPGSYTAGFPLHPFSTSCAILTTCLHVATAPLGANTPSLSEQLCVATCHCCSVGFSSIFRFFRHSQMRHLMMDGYGAVVIESGA